MIVFADLLSQLKEASAGGDFSSAWGALRFILQEPFKVSDLQKLNRAILQHESEWRTFTENRTRRVALLGGYTTQPIRELLLPLFLAEGCWVEVYEGNYNGFETEPLDYSNPLYAFRPDIVLLATGSVNITNFPGEGLDESSIRILAEREIARFQQRWQPLIERTGAQIIQHNFEPPATLPLGRLEGRYPWSKTRFVRLLNDLLWEHEGQEIRILDVHGLSGETGRTRWHQTRWYHHSKHGFDPAFVTAYGRALAGMVRSILGKTRKCLVTDLDNTLWGGVIGDDGLNGIALGTISGEGEAFAAFGRYLQELRRLGVILAANSKNEASVAREVFEKHPESPLRLEDFAALVCNWEPKSENLKGIAKSLNIGLDSIVFVDDNPAECAEVRKALPSVTVVELTGDAASFPSRLEELHLFTPLDLTSEDLSRQESYRSMAKLSAAAASPGSLGDYLKELAMSACVRPALETELPRIEQLFGKTNQFNLTGRKYSATELRVMLGQEDAVIFCAQLQDRLANHGLVSALVARIDNQSLTIENWVMSCRVFTRTLEEAIFMELENLAAQNSCHSIKATFIESAKNGYVNNLYPRLGFQAVPSEEGTKQFEFQLPRRSDLPILTHVKLTSSI